MTSAPKSALPLERTKKTVKTAPAPAIVKAKAVRKNFLADDPIYLDVVPNEQIESERQDRLRRIVYSEAIAIAVLSGLLIVCMPFLRPIYEYYALNPQQQILPLVALAMPNMTNSAVLSWSTTSVTEIMTIGFGDFQTKLPEQKIRFTTEGWDSFTRGFNKQKIGQSFREHQLVLTTVPSNTAVITGQGENEDHIYQWMVQVPVIMTYATNNNVTRRQHALIELTIVRVPATQSDAGIAIKAWSLGDYEENRNAPGR